MRNVKQRTKHNARKVNSNMSNRAKELRIAIARAHRNKAKIAAILNRAGKETHERLIAQLAAQFVKIKHASKYSFCTAEALCWAELGNRKTPRYFEIMTAFFDGRINDTKVPWEDFSYRYGPEDLKKAAMGYIQLRKYLPESVKNGTASAAELVTFQDAAQGRALDLAKAHRLSGFGAWLFCGPSKILAIMTPRMWKDPALQKVKMPLGENVIRAFATLHKMGGAGIDPKLFQEIRGGLAGGFASLYIAQKFQVDLAKRHTGASVLHINTGLHLLRGGGGQSV